MADVPWEGKALQHPGLGTFLGFCSQEHRSGAGREEGGCRQGPQLAPGHCPPWPGPAPAPAGSGGLVLRLDRKMNEFHYGIAILFHVSGSLRLTCSPGCDKPRHPRAGSGVRGLCTVAGHGAAETLPCPPRANRALLIPTDSSWEPSSTCGGGEHQGRALALPLRCPCVVPCPEGPLATQGLVSCRRGRGEERSQPSSERPGAANTGLGGRKGVGHGDWGGPS